MRRSVAVLALLAGCAVDADGDGYTDDDCDDGDPTVHPGATEVCDDGVDQDCAPGPGPCRYAGTTAAAAVATAHPYDTERAEAGAALAVGDLDGDGIDDLAVGAPGLGDEAGGVWVLLGGPHGEAALLLSGTVPGARAGSALAIGDFDGDGTDDLAVGAPGTPPLDEGGDEATGFGAGGVVLVPGPLTGDAALPATTWPGRDPGDCAGAALATGTLDGADALLVGAPCRGSERFEDPPTGFWVLSYGGGEAYALRPGDASLAEATIRWPGGEHWERAGSALAQIGDTVLVGAPNYFGAEWIHPDARGRVRGYSTALRGTVEADAASLDLVGSCCGLDRFDSAGAALHADADGLLIGAPGLNDFAVLGGAFWFDELPRGEGSAWDGAILAAPPTPGVDAEAGSVLGAADLDCDGTRDLVVAAPRATGGADESGVLHVLFDAPGPFVELAERGLRLQGGQGDELLGSAVATGDFDGDGCDDLVVGAAGLRTGGHRAGGVWLLPGRGE